MITLTVHYVYLPVAVFDVKKNQKTHFYGSKKILNPFQTTKKAPPQYPNQESAFVSL
jgi:hypothetical protein